MRFLACLAAAVLLSCLPRPSIARDLVVGQLVDYAGKHGESARDYVAGATTCFDSINAHGGLNGERIRHVVIDLAGDLASGPARIRELADARRADVLFGFVGDELVEAAARDADVRAGRLALFAPLSGGEVSSDVLGVTFARPSYEAEVKQVVGHFVALQVDRFTVVRGGDAQGAAVETAFQSQLAARSLKLAGTVRVARIDSPTAAELAAVRATGAQAIIVVADSVPVAEFVKRYRPLDPGVNVVTLSTVNPRTLFEVLGPGLAHGVMITQVVPNPMLPDTPLAKEHLDAFRTFRDEPPSHLTLEGFVAAKALVEAMRRSGREPGREAIAAAVRRGGRYDLHGMVVDLSREARRSSPYVDIAMIRRNGGLLQ